MADQTEVERQFEAWFANHGYKFGLPKFEMLPVFFAENAAGYEAGERAMRKRAGQVALDAFEKHALAFEVASAMPARDRARHKQEASSEIYRAIGSLPLTEGK